MRSLRAVAYVNAFVLAGLHAGGPGLQAAQPLPSAAAGQASCLSAVLQQLQVPFVVCSPFAALSGHDCLV